MEKYIKSPRITRITRIESSESFLQSSMWGEFKSRFGWKAYSFALEIEEKTCSLLVLFRRLAPGLSFAYIPWGPEIECGAEELCGLAEELKYFLPRNTVFVRYDLPQEKTEDFAQMRKDTVNAEIKRLKKANVDIQAPDTVVIDLTKSCEEILANMKSKWRYNISLAKKKEVQVQSYGQELLLTSHFSLLTDFYTLLKETAARDGIFIHSIEYYKTLFELCEKEPECELRLYTATHETDMLASIVVLFRGDWATYLYGASSNIKRNLMAPYALQWKAMQDAKEKGCVYYDLFGIPPNEDPNHPMAGLYRFKTGFGGAIVHRPGCWDYAYKKTVYNLYRFAESFRKKIIDLKKRK